MLERLREDREREGFSLIELIIAVAIVAILAAVAIPIFLNQRTKATQAVIQSDIKSIQTEMETIRAANGGAIPITGATLQAALSPGLRLSKGTIYYIYPNCTVETTATSVEPGEYVIRGNPYGPPQSVWQQAVWLYDSKTGSWFLNDGTRYNNMHTICDPTQPRAGLATAG